MTDPGGPRRGGTSWELLPVVALFLALVLMVLLADPSRPEVLVLTVGLAAGLGILLGKTDVGG